MTSTQITKSQPVEPNGLASHSRPIIAAHPDDVMREQLEYLIEHAQGGPCGCHQCLRLQRARSVLFEIFR